MQRDDDRAFHVQSGDLPQMIRCLIDSAYLRLPGAAGTAARTMFFGMVSQRLRVVVRIADACFTQWQLSGGGFASWPITLAEYIAVIQSVNILPVNISGDPLATHYRTWSEPRYVGGAPSGVIQHGDVADFGAGDGATKFNGPSPALLAFGHGTNRQANVAAVSCTGSTTAPTGISVNVPMKPGVSCVNGVIVSPPGG